MRVVGGEGARNEQRPRSVVELRKRNKVDLQSR